MTTLEIPTEETVGHLPLFDDDGDETLDALPRHSGR
jgi:hypothetical protein